MKVRSLTLMPAVLCCTLLDLVISQRVVQRVPTGVTREVGQRLLECSIKNKKSDQGFNQCLRSTMEGLRSFIPTGLPEFNIDPLDPLKVKNLKFKSDPKLTGPIEVTAELSDVRVEGLRNFITEEIIADRNRKTLFVRIRVPRIRVTGDYRAQGRVLVMLEGAGPFNANLTQAVGIGNGRIVTVGPPDNRRLSVADTNIDFQIGSVQIHLDNLFDGKFPTLAKVTNDLLNSKSQEIINHVKPQIKAEVENLFESVMAKAFSALDEESHREFFQEFSLPRASRNVGPFRPAPLSPLARGANRRQQVVRQGRRGFSG